MPVFGLAGVIFRMLGIPIGKFDFEFVEAEIFHHGESEIDASFDFGFDLLRSAENVGVVLGEAADAQQAVEHAAALVAINGAEFRQAHREDRDSCAAWICRSGCGPDNSWASAGNRPFRLRSAPNMFSL